MSGQSSDALSEAIQRQLAISTWDYEGGAGPCGPQAEPITSHDRVCMPEVSAAELGALHIRVIALENLVIGLLSTASARQIELAREMATYISPRSGFTSHPLTIHAAAHMLDLVERASRFSSKIRL